MADTITINVANNFAQTTRDLAALTKQFAATNKQVASVVKTAQQTRAGVAQSVTAANLANKASIGLLSRIDRLVDTIATLPVETARLNSEFLGFRNALGVATGALDTANTSLMTSVDIAKRLKLPVQVMTKEYAKFMNAVTLVGFSQEEAIGFFEDLSSAARTLNLDTQSLQGMMLALEQMVSKGTVSMEELRRQLGNALPGAVDIAALSLGYAEDEIGDFIQAVRNGEIEAKAFLSAFAPFLRARTDPFLAESLTTATAAMTELGNEWTEFKIGFGNFVSPEVKYVAEFFADTLQTVNSLLDSMRQFRNESDKTTKDENFGVTKETAKSLDIARESIQETGDALTINAFKIAESKRLITALEDGIGELTQEQTYLIKKQKNAADTLKSSYNPAIKQLEDELNAATIALQNQNAALAAHIVLMKDLQKVEDVGGVFSMDPIPAYGTNTTVSPEDAIPAYGTGTQFVPKDGLAYLHKGEAVIPADKNNGLESFASTSNTKRESPLKDYLEDVPDMLTNIEHVGVNAFKGIEDSIVSLVTTGKFNFRSLAQSIISDLTRMIAKQMIFNAVSGIFGGMGGAGVGAGIGFGGFTARGLATGTPYVPRDGLHYLHKGERVVPAQQNTITNNTTERPVNIINVTDPSQIADVMSSSAGEEVMMNFINRNPDAIRQVLQ